MNENMGGKKASCLTILTNVRNVHGSALLSRYTRIERVQLRLIHRLILRLEFPNVGRLPPVLKTCACLLLISQFIFIFTRDCLQCRKHHLAVTAAFLCRHQQSDYEPANCFTDRASFICRILNKHVHTKIEGFAATCRNLIPDPTSCPSETLYCFFLAVAHDRSIWTVPELTDCFRRLCLGL